MFKDLHDFLGYCISCVASAQDELPAVQVFRVKQTVNSTKFWIRREGVYLASNKGRIPRRDLWKIKVYLLANRDMILDKWYETFNRKEDNNIG